MSVRQMTVSQPRTRCRTHISSQSCKSVKLSDLQFNTAAGNVGQTNDCIAGVDSLSDLYFQSALQIIGTVGQEINQIEAAHLLPSSMPLSATTGQMWDRHFQPVLQSRMLHLRCLQECRLTTLRRHHQTNVGPTPSASPAAHSYFRECQADIASIMQFIRLARPTV